MANGDNLPYQTLDVVPFTPITSEWGDGIGSDILALAAGTGLDDEAITTPKIGDGAVTPEKQDGTDLIYVTETSLPGSGLELGSITIPAKTFDYYLDVSAYWSGSPSALTDYTFQILDGATVLAQCQHRAPDNNMRFTVSIPGICSDVTAGTIAPMSVSASTSKTITFNVSTRSGLTNQRDGLMIAKLLPKA